MLKALTRALGRGILRLSGWTIDGSRPNEPQFIVCVAPHTSNWDFVVGYAAKMAVGLEANWLAKNSLFRGPMGWLLRAMGGIPVDRSAAHGVVAQTVDWFRKKPSLVLAVTPEGTRRKVDRWKTGFYHIAHAAGVPIWPVGLDWGERTVRLGALVETSGNEVDDLERLQEFFRRIHGRHPDQSFPPPHDLIQP